LDFVGTGLELCPAPGFVINGVLPQEN